MKKLIQKFLNKETITYVIFGVLTTAVNYVSYWLFRKADISFLIANVMAWIVAVCFAYITNKLFVFESKSFAFKVLVKEIPSFIGARVLSLLFEEAFLAIAVHFGMNDMIAKIIAAVVVVILNYFASKFIIFKKKKSTDCEEETMPEDNDNVELTPQEIKTIKHEERRRAMHELTHGRAVYVMSFIVPIVIMIAIYMMRDIFPFGNNCYLRSDMYHQYCPFFSELWEKLRTGGSLSYTWDVGMGTNFLAIFGYYLSSPTNWFIALFPHEYMIEVMNVIIILKLAASSFTFTYYICKHTGKRHISAAIFGLFYALSAYIAAYSWNLMWLDCILLLPLIVLGLERLVNEGKGILYAVTLGLAILSNYYISIMICIALVIYFVIAMVSRPVPKDKTEYACAALRFIGYSLLAGGIAAVVLIPEICALGYTASGNFNFPETMTRYFSFITIISRHLMNIEVSTGLDHLPNVYCGVAVFILFPLYICSRKITKREKIVKVLALFVFFTAFNLNIPNFVWHGFHYPNSLPCRQSFIYIFLLLTMCYDAVKDIREHKTSTLGGCLWGALLFLIYLGHEMVGEELDFKIVYTSGLFILIYALIILVIRKWHKITNFAMIALYVVAVIEATMNMESTGYSTTSRTYYFRDYNGIETVLDNLEENDTDFYRLHKAWGYRSKNDSAWHRYSSGSIFSSTAYAHMTKFYDKLGLEHSTNAYALNGATPVVYSFFNVKYLISNKIIEADGIFSFYDGYDGEFLYENKYVLPLGFMVPEEFVTSPAYLMANNPFVVQNTMVENATGITNVFTPIMFEDNGSSITITPETDQHIYVYITNKSVDTVSASIDGKTESFKGINHGRMVDLGYVSAGSIVTVSNADDGSANISPLVYTMDVDKYTEAMTMLASEGLEITSYDDTNISGTITASNDGYMFTSIPYDTSWTVYVDGVKTEYTTTAGAFISVPVSAGTHSIEFEYVPNGLHSGLAITIICLILLAGCIVFRVKFKKEITEEGAFYMMLDTFKKSKTNVTDSDTPEIAESEDEEK